MTTLIVEWRVIAIIRSMQDSHRKLIFTFCHCKLALAIIKDSYRFPIRIVSWCLHFTLFISIIQLVNL